MTSCFVKPVKKMVAAIKKRFKRKPKLPAAFTVIQARADRIQMHSYEDWRKRGRQVTRGEKAHWVDGKPVFLESQTHRRYERSFYDEDGVEDGDGLGLDPFDQY